MNGHQLFFRRNDNLNGPVDVDCTYLTVELGQPNSILRLTNRFPNVRKLKLSLSTSDDFSAIAAWSELDKLTILKDHFEGAPIDVKLPKLHFLKFLSVKGDDSHNIAIRGAIKFDQIQKLQLHNVSIERYHFSTLNKNPHIIYLDLQKLQIIGLTQRTRQLAFSQHISTVILYLSSQNALGLSGLRCRSVDHIRLENVSNAFNLECGQIKHLTIKTSSFEILKANMLSNLRTLEVIRVDDTVFPEIFSHLSKLTNLEIRDCTQLQQIPMLQSPQLDVLRIYNCSRVNQRILEYYRDLSYTNSRFLFQNWSDNDQLNFNDMQLSNNSDNNYNNDQLNFNDMQMSDLSAAEQTIQQTLINNVCNNTDDPVLLEGLVKNDPIAVVISNSETSNSSIAHCYNYNTLMQWFKMATQHPGVTVKLPMGHIVDRESTRTIQQYKVVVLEKHGEHYRAIPTSRQTLMSLINSTRRLPLITNRKTDESDKWQF